MNTKALRHKILDLAIHGKLVPPVCRQAGKTLMVNPESPVKVKNAGLLMLYAGFIPMALVEAVRSSPGTAASPSNMTSIKAQDE